MFRNNVLQHNGNIGKTPVPKADPKNPNSLVFFYIKDIVWLFVT